MKVLGISGSLRRDSHNTKLLRAAAELLPPGAELELWEGFKAVPAYDADDDTGEPRPWILQSLAGAIEAADVVLFATPEYNHSVPGQLKNALDWLSRPLASSPSATSRSPWSAPAPGCSAPSGRRPSCARCSARSGRG